MKKIIKVNPHESISAFQGISDWTLSKDYHAKWREFILQNEQDGLSAYTELPIKMGNSHIDHFLKRSLFHNKVHSWENLIVDGIDETYGAKYKDKIIKTCEENTRLLNPIFDDPCMFFKYKVDGRIMSLELLSDADKERAEFTINTFNLNEASLVERRRMLFNIGSQIFRELTLEESLEYLNSYGFPSVIEQIYNERESYDYKKK